MKILGLSAFYHDAAATLLVDGKVRAAAQEERFTRIKHDARFPGNAILYCLDTYDLTINDMDYIVFYEKPFLKFERLLETYLAFAPKGFSSFVKALPVWTKEKLFQKDRLIKLLQDLGGDSNIHKKLLFSEHHMSHAASAFYTSPFEEALVLTLDGVGEWTTTSAALGFDNKIDILKELHFPHSLGMLYSAFTYYTGFKVNSGEYKLMGLAPYGEPKYAQLILDNLIDVKEDGSFKLNMRYFGYCTSLRMINREFESLFGIPTLKPNQKLTQIHMDIAASIQQVTEDVLIKMVRALVRETNQRNLCLAGGVALNCVANGKILRENLIDDLWIQPAAGDSGGSLGAALDCYYRHLNFPRSISKIDQDGMSGSYLGPEFSNEEIEKRLTNCGATYHRLSDADLLEHTAKYISNSNVIGWFQGRMEFGPRALGNRSIIADPRSEKMQSNLNLKIKYRESFRPFAPAVLEEDMTDWFQLKCKSPYMLLVANVNENIRYPVTAAQTNLFGIEKLNVPRSTVPAITHINYSARIQTVSKDTNARFHSLISKFKEKTGCGMLINTSFNVRGEPIVCTPEDAFRCFMGTEMDILIVGNMLMLKEEQNPVLKLNYKDSFDLD